jgi:hypothetical protein
MDKDKIQGLFLSGLCEEITDYIPEGRCRELYAKLQDSLGRARCKCKHKGIRSKVLNVFNKELKNLD